MLLTEYNEAETMKLFQRDSYNQGKEDGFKLGKEDGFKLGKEDGFKLGKEDGFKLGNVSMLVSLVKDAVISISEAAKRLNISEADFQKLMDRYFLGGHSRL